MSFAVSSVARIARSYLYAVPFVVPIDSKAAVVAVVETFLSTVLMRPVQSLKHHFEEFNG